MAGKPMQSGHVADPKGERINHQLSGHLGALPVLPRDDLAGADRIRIKVPQAAHIDAVHLHSITWCIGVAFCMLNLTQSVAFDLLH